MTERCIIYIERLRWLLTLINRIAHFSIWSKAIAWKYCTLQRHWVMFRLINIPYLNAIAYPNTEEHRTTDETELSNNWDKQAIDKLLGTWKKAGNFKLVPRNKRRNGTGQPSNFQNFLPFIGPGGGWVLPIMAYTTALIREGSARKGYLFQASGIWKSRDFTRWSVKG